VTEAVIAVVRAAGDGCQHPKYVELPIEIRGITGGTDQTSGGCSLCYTIPI